MPSVAASPERAVNLTKERAAEIFSYDPDTGTFRWLNDIRGGRNMAFVKARAGDVAGFHGGERYWVLSVGGVHVAAHRVAWLLMTGELPTQDIDHINGVRDDNRWANLRHATRSENMENLKRPHADNQTGFLGVTRKRDKFEASITKNRRRHRLGVFESPQEAHQAYLRAKRRLHARSTL